MSAKTLSRIKELAHKLSELEDREHEPSEVDTVTTEMFNLYETLSKAYRIEAMNYVARLYNNKHAANGEVPRIPVIDIQ